MRFILTVLAFVLAFPLLFIAGSSPAAGKIAYRYAVHHKMTKATDARPATEWLVKHGFDVAGLTVGKQEIEVITDDPGIALLTRSGFKGRIIERQIDGRGQVAPDPRYLNPSTAAAKIQDLAKQYPTLTRVEQVGSSNQNRPVWALLVSTTPGKDDPAAQAKPSIVFDGQHHAREIMTSEVVMDVADHLLQGYASGDPVAKKILDSWNVWVLPMLNVDGVNIVFTNNSFWRKNAASSGGTVYGVDINRNYPYRWADCDGSSSSRTAEDYHGPSAASEPETRALMNLWEMAHPTASLSYHSYSELVLYPFGCDGAITGENALEEKVGNELAAILPNDTGGGHYDPGTPWKILYAVDGDSMDYVFSQYGALTYTFEVNQQFQPPYSLRQPTLEKHRKAWKYFLDRASKNLLSLKVVDSAGQPLAAQIGVSTILHTQQEQPFTTNTGGSWFKVLDPGAYTVTLKAANGATKEIAVTMSGQPQQIMVSIK